MKTRIRPLCGAAWLGALIVLGLPSPAQAQRSDQSDRQRPMKFDRSYGREQLAIKKALGPVVAEAARSTHKVLVEGTHTALATVVHPDGWLLTKASELKSPETLEVEFSGGLRLPVTVSDRLDAYDLALLKVEARGLKPVTWSDRPVPSPGSFLAAPSPNEGVAAVGVASVGLRNRYQPPRGYMGVQLQWKDGAPAAIEKVFEGGAAEEAGVQEGDVILQVDGVVVEGREALVGEISRRRPGETVTLKIKRGDEEIEVKLTLMDRRESMGQFGIERDPMVLMSGRLSRQRHSFFNVFQHDLVLAPEECGGPLVDLDGHIVGLDIARSGRVESLAIPAADLKNLLAHVTTGKFTLPDIGALREELKKTELAIRTAQQARDEAEQTLKRAQELHATLPEPPPAQSTAETVPAPPAPSMPVQAEDPSRATEPASMP
ncbi:MAG: PDZ domain-containing protein [Verrucomicrobiales bacterium]